MMSSVYEDIPLLDEEQLADFDWDVIASTNPTTQAPFAGSYDNTPRTSGEHEHTEESSEDEYPSNRAPKQKQGGYDSRIEQILYENPKLPILIVDAGKSAESGGKYIVYTIRTGVCFQIELLRRC
jgi:hypothetical protein